jgi:membrane-associated phospholipid phosphatase
VLRSLDLALLRLLRTRGHTPAAEAAVKRFSKAGEYGLGWVVLSLVLPGDRLRNALTVAIAFAANQAVKFAVRRPRPQLEDLPPLIGTATQLSYPSAHATTAFAAARVLGPGFLPLAAAMALSRLYLGVHYPSDTLAGAALGDAVARLAA